jgi:hypothetical protein
MDASVTIPARIKARFGEDAETSQPKAGAPQSSHSRPLSYPLESATQVLPPISRLCRAKRLISNIRHFTFHIPHLLFLCLPLCAVAQLPSPNLVPNGTFAGPDPLKGWRVDFPYEGPYAKNKNYISVTSEHSPKGGKCVQILLPPGVAGNEGGKIESDFIKAEPGATYRVEIDCLTFDFNTKTFVEAWVTDPKPIPQPDKFRVPASAGHPPLVMVYRAQIPDAQGHSKNWQTVSREFTLPTIRRVGGKDLPPEFLSVKAYVYAPTPNGGKSFFANFRLTKVKSAPPQPPAP